MSTAPDPWHRDTRDLAVRALERADQAHDRIDREEAWRIRIDEKVDDLMKAVTSLQTKLAIVAAVASVIGSIIATVVAKHL
jgi:phage shock protein A